MKYALLLTAFIVMDNSTESNHQKKTHSINDPAFVSLDLEIGASAANVWDIITSPEYAKILGNEFAENAFQDSDWQLGSEVHFTFEPDNVMATGNITKLVKEELIQVDYDFDGFEYTEQYTLLEQDNGTLLQVYAGPYAAEQYKAHETVWGNWLQKVKELSEAEYKNGKREK